MSEKTPKLCLIDASAYIHRAFHALPLLATSKGQPVNAVYGFSRMVSKILKNEKPEYLGVCFDTPKPTFRHEQYADYKANRKEVDEALVSQLPLAYELAVAWGLPCIKLDGYEADDVIATLTMRGRQQGWDVLILSGDKDILQLVQSGITVRDEIRRVDYNGDRVVEKYGLTPRQLVDYFCLTGDKIDNVMGVPGVGEKTATKLLQEYGTLEAMYEKIDSVKGALKEKLVAHKEQVFTNRSLIILKKDVPLNLSDNDMKVKPPMPTLEKILNELEFRGDLEGAAGTAPISRSLALNTNRKVHVVLTQAQLEELKEQLDSAKEISFDFETDSLDAQHCGIVGLAISTKENEAWYIPIGHRALGSPTQLIWENVATAIQPAFENPSVTKVAQNLKFDNAILRRHGINLQGPQFDTMVAAYCLDPNRTTYGLKDLTADYLNEKMTRFEELFTTKKFDISEVAIDQVSAYAGADAEVTIRLNHLFKEKLSKDSVAANLFNTIEMPLVEVIESMEKAGIKIDVDYLKSVGQKFELEKGKVEKEVFALAEQEFTIGSPKQLGTILFDKLKLPPGKKNKTGYSTSEDVLSELAKDNPICQKVLDFRELAKLISTYVDGFLEAIDPVTHRVHTCFQQTGTVTGRLSSTSPNLQNIPIRSEHGREIRRAFIASQGHTLVSADYSQIDLRALAHMSGDPVLIETFKKGGDIHTATASEIFHTTPADVTAEMRRRAKAINFGIVYGQQAWGLSQSLGIELAEAQDFIKKYFERYAGVRAWIDETLANARKSKVVSTWAGRRRRVDDIVSTNASLRGFAERVAMNTPIQGTSADLIKLAMIRVHHRLRNENFKAKMLIQVHDELVFDVPDQELESVCTLVKHEMEQAAQLQVPLVVDIKSGRNWTDMKKSPMAVTA